MISDKMSSISLSSFSTLTSYDSDDDREQKDNGSTEVKGSFPKENDAEETSLLNNQQKSSDDQDATQLHSDSVGNKKAGDFKGSQKNSMEQPSLGSSPSSSSMSSIGSFFEQSPKNEKQDLNSAEVAVGKKSSENLPPTTNLNKDQESCKKSPLDVTGSQLSLLELVTDKVPNNNTSTMNANEIESLKNSSSSSSSSITNDDISDDGSTTSEPSSVKKLSETEKNSPSIAPKPLVRPKSAKPPRPSKESSVNNKKENKPFLTTKKRNPRRHIKSSSTSSVTISDRDNDVGEQTELNEHKQQERELLLHRYLDEHLAIQLDRQRSYFYHAFPVDSSEKRRSQKNASIYSIKGKNRFRSRGNNCGMLLPSFSPRVREEEVKRNMERLVSELAKHEVMRDLIKPANRANLDRITNKETNLRKNRSGKSMRWRKDSDSDSSYNCIEEQSQRHRGRSRRLQDFSLKNEQIYDDQQKSNLKTAESGQTFGKHVRLMDERNKNQTTKKRKNNFSSRANLTGSQLAALLSAIGPADCILSDNYGQLHHVTLRHTPIKTRTAPGQHRFQPKLKRKRKQRFWNQKSNPEKIDNNSSDAITSDVKTKSRPKSAKSKQELSEEIEKSQDEKATPRVRPGTEPIKCNWSPETEKANQAKLKYSDHQLKNSSNPAILEWLTRKNFIQRKTRIQKIRENRSRRDRLMEEQNEKEDKRANALIEYEKWKKKKNRDIMLRRRREVSQVNEKQIKDQSISEGNRLNNTTQSSKLKDTTITTFSDLRSSSVAPHPPQTTSSKATDGVRRRPKSAPTKVIPGSVKGSNSTPKNFVPVRIDVEKGDVTVLSPHSKSNQKNLSARETIIQGHKNKVGTHFMNDLLNDKAPTPSMFDVPSHGTFSKLAKSNNSDESIKSPEIFDKEHYNNWIKSKGTSSPYQIKYNKKKVNKAALPPHDPLTNEMLSDLAKRRIKKILDQKKRVDSGLERKKDQNPKKTKVTPDNSITKWQLKEDPRVDMNLQPMKRRSRKDKEDERPVFSFSRKTKPKSIFHQRNPLISQALDT